MDSMFDTLLDLASSPDLAAAPTIAKKTSSSAADADDGFHIRALACACLLSFTVALADTGKLLRAASAMLMSPKGSERIAMPQILVNLQRSVVSVMLAKTEHPDWMSRGVLRTSNLDTFPVQFKAAPGTVHSLACDGGFVYLQTDEGMFKIGSGYGGTIKGKVYCHRPDFEPRPGWIGVIKGSLYFKPCPGGDDDDDAEMDDGQFEIYKLDTERLVVTDTLAVRSSNFSSSSPANLVTFSDGSNIGVVTVTNNDNFVIKFFSVSSGGGTTSCVQDLPLKLARKCVDVYGASTIEPASRHHQVDFAGCCDDEAADLRAGVDFALMLSSQGKLYYTGKSSSIGHKQPCPAGHWNEVSVSRSPKITQMAVGHDGGHALFLSDEGSVYFAGTARRGEDGDAQAGKSGHHHHRRAAKAVKPKRMARVDGAGVVQMACNNGTSVMVGRDGEVFVFGKDSSHADYNTGIVTDLKGKWIVQVR
jgi:E3 ubiquitin-protein ligase MYCBP2